ncbi:hypothetical protein EHM69_01185 [candidate division KSB1 bacterium]|nr:MAG: hypothetical protein EHM69_01185 [candidate division KSB1 bacterium]
MATVTLKNWPRAAALLSLLALFCIMEGIYLFAEHQAAGRFGFGLDDSWIHATFARNLIEGRGYGLNPGEPVAGSTAPLYTFLLAGWYAILSEVIWGAKLFGMLGLAASACLLYLAAERLANSRFVAWLAAAFCLASPALLWSSLNGMETTLYLVIPCAALFFWTRERYRWMIAMLALGVWLRPEGVILLTLGWMAIPSRHRIPTAIYSAAILLPYFAMNLCLSGYPFPATVHTKSFLQEAHFSTGLIAESLSAAIDLHFFPVFLTLPLGLIALWKRVWWAALYPLLFFLVEWGTSSTIAAFARYLQPAFPFVYLAIAFGVVPLLQKWPSWSRIIRIAVFCLLVLQISKTVSHAAHCGQTYQNIARMQVAVSRIVHRVTESQETVATNDIGALGYFSNRYVIDLMGLARPYQPLEDILRMTRPTMLAIFDSWFPYRMDSRTFKTDYEQVGQVKLEKNIICGDYVMSLYARRDRAAQIKTVIGEVIEEETGQR